MDGVNQSQCGRTLGLVQLDSYDGTIAMGSGTTQPVQHVLIFAVTLALFSGCFVGTPEEEVLKLGGKIEVLNPEGSIRITLTGVELDRHRTNIVTSVCYNHRSKYRALTELKLPGCTLTDAAIEHLEMNPDGVASLVLLDLRGTDVSDAAVEALKEIIPDCEIVQ